MSKVFGAGFAVLLTLASTARAQDASASPAAPPPPPSESPVQGPPPGVNPGDVPPQANLAPPSAPPDEVPQGQWVQTTQYGWVWMPYSQAYAAPPPAPGTDPYLYMYAPAYGWRWFPAPWVLGIGPRPYFGVYGYARFGWYGHGWYGSRWYGYGRGSPPGYRGVVVVHPHGYYGARTYAGHGARGNSHGGGPYRHPGHR